MSNADFWNGIIADHAAAQAKVAQLSQLAAVDGRKDRYRFGDWHIYFEPPPIPCRNSDWHFYHDDYDGAPDSNDMRAGHAESVEGCLREIADIEGWLDGARILREAAKQERQP